jgi:4-hydroxy-2-oxoheptanedioate aldolase
VKKERRKNVIEIKPFRELLNEKEVVYGTFAKTCDPLIVKAIGKSGFDFIILDNEHGPNSVRETYPLILASQVTGIYPIVRVGKLSDIEIQRTLDLGVAGIQIPQVKTKEDAKNARVYSKFYPKGMRGVCRFVSAADCGFMDKDTYFQKQNEVAVIIQIEGVEGIQNIDEIIKVNDFDVIFIGPYDLSQSLGIPGEIDNPKLTREIEKLVDKCRREHKHIGIYADDVARAKHYKALGIKYIAVSVEVNLLGQRCFELVNQLRAL